MGFGSSASGGGGSGWGLLGRCGGRRSRGQRGAGPRGGSVRTPRPLGAHPLCARGRRRGLRSRTPQARPGGLRPPRTSCARGPRPSAGSSGRLSGTRARRPRYVTRAGLQEGHPAPGLSPDAAPRGSEPQACARGLPRGVGLPGAGEPRPHSGEEGPRPQAGEEGRTFSKRTTRSRSEKYRLSWSGLKVRVKSCTAPGSKTPSTGATANTLWPLWFCVPAGRGTPVRDPPPDAAHPHAPAACPAPQPTHDICPLGRRDEKLRQLLSVLAPGAGEAVQLHGELDGQRGAVLQLRMRVVSSRPSRPGLRLGLAVPAAPLRPLYPA